MTIARAAGVLAGLVLVPVLLGGALSCGAGDDEMMGGGGGKSTLALQNVTATAVSGRSSGVTHKLWACLTWEPAGVQTGDTLQVTVGCGVILPGPTVAPAP